MKNATKNTRFDIVNLSFNVGAPLRPGPGGEACTGDTQCGGVSNDCNGPSCEGSSNGPQLGFDARILVERARLAALRNELQKLVARFVK